MKTSVDFSPQFTKSLERLSRKYHHVVDEVEKLVDQLEEGETPGDQIRGTGYTVYKTRLRSPDAGRGKSGGFRVIYYIRTATRIILITIYAKSERADILPDEIRRIIEEYGSSL